MATLCAEVVGKFDHQSDADRLLYAPLASPCTYLRTRIYRLEYDGAAEDAEAFVQRVLVDPYSEHLHFGDEPALDGFAFYLEYGMKPGALDLEKEAILTSYRGARHKKIEIATLELSQRIYLFSGGDVSPERFVRDVCNPAIHTWSVTHADSRHVA